MLAGKVGRPVPRPRVTARSSPGSGVGSWVCSREENGDRWETLKEQSGESQARRTRESLSVDGGRGPGLGSCSLPLTRTLI